MSFLRDYELFIKGNEAHPTYHLFSSLVALSSVVSRRVWIEMGHFNVYANLYVVLVGPPGNRKTTAMSTCKKLLRELGDIPFSAECVTKEKLVVDLVDYVKTKEWRVNEPPIQYTPLTVCVTELSQFLGTNSANMVDFLTTVYDQDFYELKTKNKGSQTIYGPYIVLLACTTPAWITARMRDDVISGGFSRRAIFVYETEKGAKIPFPTITQEAREAWDRVIAYSRKLQDIAGPMTWDPSARKFFEEWYMKLEIPKEQTVAGYYESKHMQLLKIALLISLSENTDLVLKKEHLEAGLAMLDIVEAKLTRVFEGIGRNELNGIASDILELLRGGRLPEKEVLKIMYRQASGDELYSVIKHLEKTERIIRLQDKVTSPDQPIRYYLQLKA